MINGQFIYNVNERFIINKVCSLSSEVLDNSLVYSAKFDNNIENKIKNLKDCIIILPNEALGIINEDTLNNNEIIFSKNPRLSYAKLIKEIEEDNYKVRKQYSSISSTQSSFRGTWSNIGAGTFVGESVILEDNVYIGKGCHIGHGVKILSNVTIGNNVVIKCNAVIGDSGFGVEMDSDGRTYKIPHIGGVIIEDDVEIGALTTVCSGTIEPTRIGRYTKIDDHVHIGHNVEIEESVIITACAEISRSLIKKGSWIGPNSSIIQGVTLEENSFVGIGSVVTKSVDKNQVVAGNPAQDIEELKKLRRKLKEL